MRLTGAPPPTRDLTLRSPEALCETSCGRPAPPTQAYPLSAARQVHRDPQGVAISVTKAEMFDRISRGRTDLVFEFLKLEDWRHALSENEVRVLQWFVYFNDVTAMKAVLEAGGDLSSIDLDEELGNAAFFGHWKMVDFLLVHGARADARNATTGETALHSALAKAGRPYILHVVKLLVAHGADVNARTNPGKTTQAFMRDVRTQGETPLHRAAAYADPDVLEFLLSHGADRELRDDNGDSPLSIASRHLRPGRILSLLTFGEHQISAAGARAIQSDHGSGWGTGMDWKLLGEFLPESGGDHRSGHSRGGSSV